jgi:mycothiol synthase
MTQITELRPPRDEDVPRLVELRNEDYAEVGDPPNAGAETITIDWHGPGFDRERHARVALIDGRVVGYVTAFKLDGRFVFVDGYVDRATRGRGAGSAMLEWGLDLARTEFGMTEVHLHAPTTRPDALHLIEEVPGIAYARTFYRMRRDAPASVPPPVWPEGIELVPMKGEELARATAAAQHASFVDHWNYFPVPVEDYLHWMTEELHDPDLWLIAMHDEQIAGFCVNAMDGEGDLRVGWIGQLGTAPPFRKRGLGRALLLEGVRRLAARGCPSVTLGVDAENPTGALKLYRTAGFEVVRETRRYSMQL